MLLLRKHWVWSLSVIVLITAASLNAGALGSAETRAVRDVGGFDRVSFSTSGRLIIKQGDEEGLVITARPGDLPDIVAEVRDGTLYIRREGSGPFLSFRPPVFRLTVTDIAGLEAHSSGSIEADGLHVGPLRILVSSSGGISIDSLVAESLDVRISSSGSCRLSGTVERQTILLSSSGTYWAPNLASRAADVRASSSGTATLRVEESLEASVTSSGDVRYYGKAPRVNGNVTSSGRLVGLGD